MMPGPQSWSWLSTKGMDAIYQSSVAMHSVRFWNPPCLSATTRDSGSLGRFLLEIRNFTAICEVARGHKRFNPTAAGRFGIGFNSVYFLTDTPVLFSRSEVHVFDLRRRMFPDDGWRFSLDDFPATASNAGPIKTVLEWALPKAVLGDYTLQEIASPDGRDYQQTLFRLPLRRTVAAGSPEERGPVFPGTSFP